MYKGVKPSVSVNFYNLSIKKVLPAILIFFTSLTIGLFTLDDHGLTWDEAQQRIIGETNYNYVFKNDTSLLSFSDRDYGVGFELPLMIVEKSFNFKSERNIYLMRHLFIHFLFLISGLFLYFLILKLTKNISISILGMLMLFLNPRIYAHSFFNSKDIPFLSILIICFYLVVIAFEQKSFLRFIILGAASAFLINLRIIGVILPIMVISLLMIDAFKDDGLKGFNFKISGVYFLTTFLILWITWPFLWPNPLINFKIAFENMAQFRLTIETLFQGEQIKVHDLPKKYAFVWIGITTPVFFLFSGLISLLFFLYRIAKAPLEFLFNKLSRQYLIYFAFLSAPFTAIFVLNSVVYDGWRQLYFIYPCLILITAFALKSLIEVSKKFKFFIYPLFAITFISLIVFMVKSAPNQQVYFNEILSSKEGSQLRKKYELDYWGASFLTALKYILEEDQSEELKIAVSDWPGVLNVSLLKPKDKKRINLVDKELATYYITNYRWNPEIIADYENKVYHTIYVQGNEITTIYKIK